MINEFDEDAIVEALKDADIVIGDYTFKIPVTERMMRAMQKVKLIQQPSTGYNNIDIEAARKLGITVERWRG